MDLKKNPDINANTEKDLTSQDWDNEIDLRKAVSVVATWWREIVLGTFLAAIMGGVVTVSCGAADVEDGAGIDAEGESDGV